MTLIFWLSVCMILYVYLGYPILISLIGLVRSKEVTKKDSETGVSILIAAYNEAENIATTIENKLNLDYPKDKIEIIVISDESTDGTDEIVKSFENKGVRLIRQEPRAGKTSALNLAVPNAKGEIIILSDANSIYDKEAVKKLVSNFTDPDVGYVTGKMIYTDQKGSVTGDGCGVYMKYENFLRRMETRAGSVVGVDGGVDAVRKENYKTMNPDQLPDFVLPLKIVEQGYRVVYEPEAILKEPSLINPKDEYKMRVRVSLRSLWALYDMRHLLSFVRFTHSLSSTPSYLRSRASSFIYSWQLWSHKVLRYFCFVFLVAAYFSNLTLWSYEGYYKLFIIAQSMAYLGAIVSQIFERKGYRPRILYVLSFFLLVNLASAHAFVRFVFRQKQVIWTPRT